MAASSHDAGVQHLPYNAFHSNPDNHHMYASLTSWASPDSLSQASGSSSAMFQRPGPSTQHQLPANGSQYTGSLDYANLNPIQSPWLSSLHYHSEPPCDEGLSVGTTVQYGYSGAQGQSSVPHTVLRPLAPGRVPELLHAQPQSHLSDAQRGHSTHLANYATPTTQTFLSSAPRTAPVARLLNYPLPPPESLHLQTQDQASQTSMWAPRSGSLTGHALPPSYSSENENPPFSPGNTVLPQQSHGPLWNHVEGGAGALANPAYERYNDPASDWALIEPRSQHGTHDVRILYPNPMSPTERAHHTSIPSGALTQSNKRSIGNPKLPTIPSPFIERQKKNTVSRRQGPLSREKREKAHKMRQRGPGGKAPCIRCRFYKAGCDEGDPCSKCAKTSKSARVFHLPCCRDQIEDTNLVRRCNGRFNQLEADFLKYPWRKDRNIHVMEIVWNLPGFGPVTTIHPLQIRFREYEPEGSSINTTESQWQNTNGQLVKVEQPPYAVYDTAALQNDVEAYFTHNLPSVEQWIFGRNRHDEIALVTYTEALRLRAQSGPGSELLNLALQLQYLSVISQGYGSVWSTNIPGINQYDFRAMGHSVYEAYDRDSCDRPLPIAINHQMDVALVKFLKRLEERCFKLLAKEIFKTGIRPWYELFLTLFVLFWNLEYIHSGAEGYIKSKSGTHVERHVSSVVSRQIDKWNFSFEVLMNHWQGCLRGFKPFVLARENPEELRTKGRLPDTTAFQYMTTLAALLDQQGPSRFPPPHTGLAPITTSSMASKWIVSLIKEAGG